jgi:two-component system sensor histidine kinase KdpD
MIDDSRRRTPDELLADIELEDRRKRRGQLKVFLGYASGVGKSFQMLDEGRRRRERGEDVVACALQPDYPAEVKVILNRMEIVPTVRMEDAEVIDLAAVMERRPQVALIDGLAYDNPWGSANPHRWQDVEQLLEAGISILTTVNIQYLESLQDEIERITGKRAAHIIPWTFIDKSVDEIAVVDAPAVESLSDASEAASTQLAEKHRLSRLRELALLVAASVVDRQLVTYLRAHGTEQTWGVLERILVYLPAESGAAEMLESGRRNADRFQGEFYVVYMSRGADGVEPAALEENVMYARRLGAHVYSLAGKDAAQAVLKFALEHGITQIFVARSTVAPDAWTRLRGDVVVRLIRAAEGIDVIVYPR